MFLAPKKAGKIVISEKHKASEQMPFYFEKEDVAMFNIAKSEDEKQYIFGWAQVSKTADGQLIEDWQHDVVEPEDLEEAAYNHVLNFRSTGEQHKPELRGKGKLIESCMFTEEKQKAIGIPAGTVPIGWWVGYHIEDKEAWAKVKAGEYTMFSVEGTGVREEIKDSVAKSYEELMKYNPYHDAKGRFSSRNSHTSFSPGKNPATAASSIARENAARQKDGVPGLVTGAYSMMDKVTYGENLDKYLKSKQDDGIKQTKAPDKAGKSVKWSNMTDDEFVNKLEDYMPGINDIIEKGWAKDHDQFSFIDTSLNGDMVLSDIYTARGYHGKPQVVDKDTIKDYINTNGTPELYRGMHTSSNGQTGSEKQERFNNDDLHFAGLGVLGNGTYAAETPKNTPSYGRNPGLGVARSYARSRGGDRTESCARLTLEKGTKTAAYTTIERQQIDFQGALRRAYLNGKISQEKYNKTYVVTSDVGRFAALRGYEAWYDKTGAHSGASRTAPYWVIANRSKVIVQKERYDA